MEDLFGIEQNVLDEAVKYAAELKNGAAFEPSKFETIVKEYGRLLKQLRRVTKISDRTTVTLNTSKHDLLDKVHYDALTGIYNRRFMEDSLKRIVRSLSRHGGTLSVMMMDIDYFKKYNDTYGHSEGDTCLKAVAEALAGCLSRADDFVARYGGEEFTVILPDTDQSGARVMANKILRCVRALEIPHEKNEAASCVTISIGVTTSEVAHAHQGVDYIKRADEALYQSKQRGRNRYTYVDFREEI
ncbi:MAG: GGDEF domain-containing protein [Defluviitaleaceae bacterium]|nr:GGDEF domain-containing protein [Defluviitaleaceae bacterium]MCL2837229.1 GGDEF domain-containing protein [Defluviitaleaceae bacterium]